MLRVTAAEDEGCTTDGFGVELTALSSVHLCLKSGEQEEDSAVRPITLFLDPSPTGDLRERGLTYFLAAPQSHTFAAV